VVSEARLRAAQARFLGPLFGDVLDVDQVALDAAVPHQGQDAQRQGAYLRLIEDELLVGNPFLFLEFGLQECGEVPVGHRFPKKPFLDVLRRQGNQAFRRPVEEQDAVFPVGHHKTVRHGLEHHFQKIVLFRELQENGGDLVPIHSAESLQRLLDELPHTHSLSCAFTAHSLMRRLRRFLSFAGTGFPWPSGG
jgi:hypothetical protein